MKKRCWKSCILLVLLAAVAPAGLVLAQPDASSSPSVEQDESRTPMELYQLPWEVRHELPKIEITVRHAPEDPEKRFVKINGERFAQGDTLELGPRIVEIRTDGVIIEYQGQLVIIR